MSVCACLGRLGEVRVQYWQRFPSRRVQAGAKRGLTSRHVLSGLEHRVDVGVQVAGAPTFASVIQKNQITIYLFV